MTYITTASGQLPAARATNASPTLFRRFMAFMASYQAFRTTHAELSKLSERELSDIGISRFDVPRVAMEVSDQVRAEVLAGR